MNTFEEKFFKKYVPEWQEMKDIIHSHPLNIIWLLFIWTFLWAFLPSFMYYFSEWIRNIIPFYFMEAYLYIIYIKIIYNIFDRYNDVWIITDRWVTELDWKLLKIKMQTLEYEDIEWMEVIESWPLDKILKKWSLIIHKIWDESFSMNNAISPYKWLDIIEKLKNETNNDEYEERKLELIMNTLSWVMEEYLDKKVGLKKWNNNVEQSEILEYLENYKNNDKTVNLRG